MHNSWVTARARERSVPSSRKSKSKGAYSKVLAGKLAYYAPMSIRSTKVVVAHSSTLTSPWTICRRNRKLFKTMTTGFSTQRIARTLRKARTLGKKARTLRIASLRQRMVIAHPPSYLKQIMYRSRSTATSTGDTKSLKLPKEQPMRTASMNQAAPPLTRSNPKSHLHALHLTRIIRWRQLRSKLECFRRKHSTIHRHRNIHE